MKERTAEGVGGGKRGTPSWKNMSKYCGRRVYWGWTVLTNFGKQCFFLIAVRFGLRGVPVKNKMGGISDRGKNPARVSYSFCTGVRSRCLVELFRK